MPSTNIKIQARAKAKDNTRKANPNNNSISRKMEVNPRVEAINHNLEADFLKTQTCHKTTMQV
jgi:hypothetical protein